jgi:hypothetical protein
VTTPHPSSTELPVLVPPWSVTALQTGVHRDVHAVEGVRRAADVVGEGQVVVDLLVLRRLDVAERHRIAPAAWQPAILRHVEHKRVEVGRRPRTVDRGRQVSPAPADVVDLQRDSRRDLPA